MTTHKERVLNQKPTIIVKPLFFKILETNISGQGNET